jgi:tetratricopeptide (TPR) repeat protein
MAKTARDLNRDAHALIQQGRLDEAATLLQRSLQIQPDNAETHASLGNVLVHLKRYDEAIAAYREALRLNPDLFAAHFILAIALHDKSKLDEAEVHFRKALDLNPGYAPVYQNLGAVLLAKERLDEAAACFRQAIRLDRNLVDAHNNLGNVLARQDRLPEAVNCYLEALRLDPDKAEVHFNLALAQERQDRLDLAIQHHRQALRLNPHYPEVHINLGNVFARQGDTDAAIGCYQQALQANPNSAEVYNNLGLALQGKDKLNEAVACYEQALQKKPGWVAVLNNLGNVHWQEGRYDAAMACFEQALRSSPNSVEAHVNRARLNLLLGDWQAGWSEYQWRWQSKDWPGRTLRQPRWNGGPLSGSTVLLLAEQGLGDTLQLIRYATLVKQCGAKVLLDCQPALARFLASVPGIDQMLAQGAPLPAFDVHTSLFSLPGIFETTLANVPAPVPYLFPDVEFTSHWRRIMSDVRSPISGVEGSFSSDTGHRTSDTGHVLRIGINWQGNPAYGFDRRRSIPFSHFLRLVQVEHVQFISLQKGPGKKQLLDREDRFGVVELCEGTEEASRTFSDTAAVMQNLDLVISSDTAVVHLAGGLGIPVWIALPLVPDWRWLLEREDSPWYPSMRLFRQTRVGEWADVFERMAGELENLVCRTK